MQRLGYLAINVGEREVRQGWEAFAEVTAGAELPFVSANIVRESDGTPIFPARRIVEARSADGTSVRRIAVIGAARYNPLFRKDGPDGEPIVIVHPKEAVAAQLAALEGEAVDLVVLLAALHKEDAKRLVEELPGIDYVMGSYGGAFSTRSELVGDTRLMYSGNRGQRLSESRLYLSEDGSIEREQSRSHFLTAQYPANKPMTAFVDGVLGAIAQRAAAAAAAPAAAPAGGR